MKKTIILDSSNITGVIKQIKKAMKDQPQYEFRMTKKNFKTLLKHCGWTKEQIKRFLKYRK
jgi:hypothetical protein